MFVAMFMDFQWVSGGQLTLRIGILEEHDDSFFWVPAWPFSSGLASTATPMSINYMINEHSRIS